MTCPSTWKPSLRDSISNRNFFKNWNSLNVSLAQSTLCHLVYLSRLPCPLSVTQSSLSCLPVHSLSLSLSRLPFHSLSLSVTTPPPQRLRHSASPPSLLSHSNGSLTHRLHLSGMILWLCDLFVWVCDFCSKVTDFVCYSVWFYCTCILQKRICDHGATIQSSL